MDIHAGRFVGARSLDHGISFHLTSIGDIKSPSYTMLPSSGFRGFARIAFLPRVLLELKGEISATALPLRVISRGCRVRVTNSMSSLQRPSNSAAEMVLGGFTTDPAMLSTKCSFNLRHTALVLQVFNPN
jgi:hypothetical protein